MPCAELFVNVQSDENKTIIGLKSLSYEKFHWWYEYENKTIIGLK